MFAQIYKKNIVEKPKFIFFLLVCCLLLFGYNSKNELQYRGRIAEMKNLNFVNNKNDLLDAMIEISKTQNGPNNQFASAGCSVKWK